MNGIGEFHRGCYETRQPYIHFFLGDSQRPAPAGRWLCAEEKRKDALKIRESP